MANLSIIRLCNLQINSDGASHLSGAVLDDAAPTVHEIVCCFHLKVQKIAAQCKSQRICDIIECTTFQ